MPNIVESTDLREARNKIRGKYARLYHKITEELIKLGSEIHDLPGINEDTPAAKSLQDLCVSILRDAQEAQRKFAEIESKKLFRAI